MFDELISSYEDGVPNDEQGDCIEAFFSNAHFWKEQYDFDISEATGEDEETQWMLNLVIVNFVDELPAHIMQMLKDWKEFGF